MLKIDADTLIETGGIKYLTLHSGEYDECDLVEVYREGDENKTSIGAFQACFVKFGYNFGETELNLDEMTPEINFGENISEEG